MGFIRLLVTFFPSTKKSNKNQHRQSCPFWGTWRLITNNRHHEWPKHCPASCGQLLLRSQDRQVLLFQNTLDLGNSNALSKTILPVLEFIILVLRNPCKTRKPSAGAYTTKQTVTCTQCYQGKLRSVYTNPISLHALKRPSPWSMPYVLHPCCVRSHHSSLCVLPLETGKWASLAHHPREWRRVSNKHKWTFLGNHSSDPQGVAPLHTLLTGSGVRGGKGFLISNFPTLKATREQFVATHELVSAPRLVLNIFWIQKKLLEPFLGEKRSACSLSINSW